MTKTIYIGNLPWSTTENDLANLIAPHAEVISVRLATDRDTGRSRGFGFAEVPTDAADAVIAALAGFQLEGRELTVNEARPRPERPRGGRRF